MRIQHNIPALNAHRNLTNNNSAVSKNLEKLSSGYRINRAGDDAAGLAISEKMRAQITGLQTAQKNAEDGVSLVQTAEGALTEVHSMLNRMVELATQSANGTYSESNRQEMQKEIDALNEEIDRISATSNFNGTKLFQGGGANGAAAGVPDIKGLDLQDVAATKYSVENTIPAASTTTLKKGDTFTASLNYTDANGKTNKVDITLTYDGTNLVDTNGNTYSVTATGAKDTELTAAFVGAINKDSTLSSVFKASNTGATLKLEAKTAGSTTVLNKIELTENLSGTEKGLTVTAGTTTKGTDAYQKADLKTVGKNEVFTIGGKKFAFVGSDADVNAIKIAGTNATTQEVSSMAALIEQKTIVHAPVFL